MVFATEKIVSFAKKISFDDIPEEVVEKTKYLLLDSLGIGIASTTLPISNQIKEMVFKNIVPEVLTDQTNSLRKNIVTITEGNLKDGWIVRIYLNPLVVWIWIGTFIIFIGGIFSMTNNIKKINL